MVPTIQGSTHTIPAHYSFIDPKKLSWPGWLTCSGWSTYTSGHPSDASRAQDRESLPAKDGRSTIVQCKQSAW